MRTKGQLEASVQQHLVRRRVCGAADHILPHQHLRVQRPPLSRTLLVETQPTEMQRQKVLCKEERFSQINGRPRSQFKMEIIWGFLIFW